MFGEVFSADPQVLSMYTREGRLDSVLDFAFQGAVRDVFANGSDSKSIADMFSQDDIHRVASHPNDMLTFISNHDIGRMGFFLQDAADKGAFKLDPLKQTRLAHAYMYFARGVPVVYGDEQGFTGNGGDKMPEKACSQV